MIFKFKTIKFHDEGSRIKAQFMEYFHFYLERGELEKLSIFTVKEGSIAFKKRFNEQKFYFILDKGFSSLKSFRGKPTLYVHGNSGIPLIGSNEFGIVDRGTNYLELKPITTCNIDCIYCSVDHSKRIRDIIVEEEYLTAELKKLVKIKENRVNIHIGGQGEPLMYSQIVKLVRDCRKIQKIRSISVNTNGVLLGKTLADKLIEAGITHFHVSMNAFSQKNADNIASVHYPLEKVKKICTYLAKKSKLIIVPVWISSVNDEDIEELIKFSKKIKAGIGIQNFLKHELGKKPVNSIPMKVFFQRLHSLEEKYKVDLTGLEPGLQIEPDNSLPKPFKKGQVITADIVSDGRLRNSRIAVCSDRVVTVRNCLKNGKVKVRIVRDKDNIFTAVPV